VRQQPGARRPGVLQAARAWCSTSPHGRRVRWHAASQGKSRWITWRAHGRERAAASRRGGRHAGGSPRAAQARKAVEAKQADAQAASIAVQGRALVYREVMALKAAAAGK
jgi:hypothetical protein